MMNTALSEELKKNGLKPNNRKGRRSDSILRKYRRILNVRDPKDDGVKHINVSMEGKTELGRKLHPCYLRPFNHALGRFPNMALFMVYIQTTNFPSSILEKKIEGCGTNTVDNLVRKKVCRKVHVPNYWAVVASGVWSSLKANPELMEELKDSELKFTSYKVTNVTDMGMEFIRLDYDTRLIRYMGILNEIRSILKQFYGQEQLEEMMQRFIELCKDEADKHIYEGVPTVRPISDDQDEDTPETDNSEGEATTDNTDPETSSSEDETSSEAVEEPEESVTAENGSDTDPAVEATTVN